jgi:hypothetical protein
MSPSYPTISQPLLLPPISFPFSSFANLPATRMSSSHSNIRWPAYYRSLKERKLTSQLRNILQQPATRRPTLTSRQPRRPRPLAIAFVEGTIGWNRYPCYKIPLPRYYPIRPKGVFRKPLTDQTAIGWGRMYSARISRTFKWCIARL